MDPIASMVMHHSRPTHRALVHISTPATGELNFFRSCDESQFKQVLCNLVQQLENPYRQRT